MLGFHIYEVWLGSTKRNLILLPYLQPKTFTYKRQRSEIVTLNMFGLPKLHKMCKVLL